MPRAILHQLCFRAGTGCRPSCGPSWWLRSETYCSTESDFGHGAGCGARSPRYQSGGTALLTRAEVGDPSSPLLFNSLSAEAKSPHHLKEGPLIPTLPEATIGIEGAPPPV